MAEDGYIAFMYLLQEKMKTLLLIYKTVIRYSKLYSCDIFDAGSVMDGISK